MDWTQVEERIVEDDRNKWDRKAAAEELRIATSNGLLDVGNAGRAPVDRDADGGEESAGPCPQSFTP